MRGIFPSNGSAKQFTQRVDPKLFFRARAVGLNRFQTKMEVGRDLRRGQPLAKQPEDLEFAVAQLLDRRCRYRFSG